MWKFLRFFSSRCTAKENWTLFYLLSAVYCAAKLLSHAHTHASTRTEGKRFNTILNLFFALLGKFLDISFFVAYDPLFFSSLPLLLYALPPPSALVYRSLPQSLAYLQRRFLSIIQHIFKHSSSTSYALVHPPTFPCLPLSLCIRFISIVLLTFKHSSSTFFHLRTSLFQSFTFSHIRFHFLILHAFIDSLPSPFMHSPFPFTYMLKHLCLLLFTSSFFCINNYTLTFA